MENSVYSLGTTVLDTGLQIFGFHSICGSIVDMCFEALWGGRLPHGGSR